MSTIDATNDSAKLAETRAKELARRKPTKPLLLDAEALEREYGLGDCPSARRRLFGIVAAVIQHHGPKAHKIVRSLMRQSELKRHPERYFCSAVIPRLQDEGMCR